MSDSLQRLKSRVKGAIFGASNKQTSGTGPDLSRGSVTPASTAHLDLSKSKFDFGIHQYPEDLGNNDFGHYILFHIFERSTSKYISPTFNSSAQVVKGIGDQIDKTIDTNINYGGADRNADPAEGITRSSRVSGRPIKEDIKLTANERSGFTTSFNLRKAGKFIKSKDTIALYMPPNIEASYQMEYKASDTGFTGVLMQTAGLVGEGQSMGDYLASQGNTANMNTVAASIGEMLGTKGVAKLGGMLGAGDPAGQINKMLNETPNNALEAIFKNVGFRSFSYNFRFTPRSENEVRIVDDICKLFKFHASPERMHGEKVGRQLRMPAEFDIFYMYQGAQNSWYPMIHSCVCKSVKTSYGPGGEHQSFRPIDGSPPPTEINLALEFMETEIITKELVKEGF
jgi:hypothetical protein